MTISTTGNRVSYAGNGVSLVFAFPYFFAVNSDLVVVLNKADGSSVTQVLTTNYTLTGAGTPSSGSVTMLVAPATGETLVIYRDPAFTQTADFVDNDPLPAATLEGGFDRIVVMCQRLKDLVTRSFRLADSDTSGASTTLPTPEANALLAWDQNGLGLQNILPSEIATVAVSGNALIDTFTGTGVQTAFVMAHTPGSKNNTQVFVGGVYQLKSSYSLSGSTITFSVAPGNGVAIEVYTSGALPINSVDSSAVVFQQAGTGSVVRSAQDELRERYTPTQKGAVGDFNSTTGVGTDNRLAFQRILDYALTIPGGCEITIPPGNYYLGTGYAVNSTQLLLGSTSTPNAGNNITIKGYGATIFAGASGQSLRVANCNNINILGIKFVGFAGGALDPTRQSDAPIALQSTQHVTIKDCYFTNSLGDCVYIGGEGLCLDTKILDNTMKERYGNGVRSYSSGHRSRLAVAAINVDTLLISGNTIYGGIDCENNLSSEYQRNVKVSNNVFSSGHVTPQSTIGTAYWFDEPIAATGGTVIDQLFNFAGPGFAAGANRTLVEFSSNQFESITVSFAAGSSYRVACKGNTGQAGVIICDDNSGTGVLYDVSNNTFDTVLSGKNHVIALNGSIQQSVFDNNKLLGFGAPAAYVFNTTGTGADSGYNSFCDNRNLSAGALGVFGFTTNDLSYSANNAFFQQPGAGGPWINRAKSYALQVSKQSTGAFPTVTVNSAAQALDYRALQCDTFILASSGGGTLGQITNCDPGTIILILFDAAGVTIKNSTNFRTHSGADLVAGSANSCCLCYSQGGIIRELSSNLL